jgi:hypothetical protein
MHNWNYRLKSTPLDSVVFLAQNKKKQKIRKQNQSEKFFITFPES